MAENIDENAFHCIACNNLFHSPVYSITRSNEQMHFSPGERLPEAEVLFSESVGDYCSQACLDLNRDLLLKSYGVRSTHPGVGPTESCSRCNDPVDMSSPHWTWIEEKADVVWGNGIEEFTPTAATILAVLCKQCDLKNDMSNQAK